jgi:phenylacetic acid degradation operon negative regulatory protein
LSRPAGRQRPRSLLVTMLGDYCRGRREPIASSALVALLSEFGVSEQSARATLSRLSGAGLLLRSRCGRRTFYELTDRAQRTFDEGAARIFGFGAAPPRWDGQWTVVAFSVSESDRALRHALRTQLRWLGCAPLYDGLWVSPHAPPAAATAILDELAIERATVFRATSVAGRRGGDPLLAWDLAGLRAAYEGFMPGAQAVLADLAARALPPSRALVLRTELMDAWRAFPREDPDLPAEFLPADWPRERARDLFLAAYGGLAPLAEARFRELVDGRLPAGDKIASG